MPDRIARSFLSLVFLTSPIAAFAVTTGFFVGGDPDAACARYNMQPIEVQHTCIGCGADFVGATPADVGKQFCPSFPPAGTYAYGTYTPMYVYPGGTGKGWFHCLRKYDGVSIEVGGSYNTYYRCTDACSLSLRLGSDNGNAGLGETRPGGKITGLYAEVTCNGEPKPDIEVTLKVEAQENSGGHQHHAGRPTGAINGASEITLTTGNAANAPGRAYFEFGAPIVSGDHNITARCATVNCGSAEGEVWVGVRGLVPMHNSSDYKLIGKTGDHPKNYYLTASSSAYVAFLAFAYNATFPTNRVLQLNDMSLERGGLFDVGCKKDVQDIDGDGNRKECLKDSNGVTIKDYWNPPHRSHRRGTSIDISAQSTSPAVVKPHSMPVKNFAQFQIMVKELMAKFIAEDIKTRNAHYHVEFSE